MAIQSAYVRTGERLSPIGQYSTEDITLKLNPNKKISLYRSKESNTLKISIPNCGLYNLSKHKSKVEAEKKAKEYDKKLKKGYLIKIIDRHNVEIIE